LRHTCCIVCDHTGGAYVHPQRSFEDCWSATDENRLAHREWSEITAKPSARAARSDRRYLSIAEYTPTTRKQSNARNAPRVSKTVARDAFCKSSGVGQTTEGPIGLFKIGRSGRMVRDIACAGHSIRRRTRAAVDGEIPRDRSPGPF